MTAPDLLPCPWCGSPAELERGSDHHGEWFNLGCSRHWGAVGPENACLGGRLFYTETEVAESVAAARWNTRATPAAMTPDADALYSLRAWLDGFPPPNEKLRAMYAEYRAAVDAGAVVVGGASAPVAAMTPEVRALVEAAQDVKDFRYDPNIGIKLNILEERLAALRAGGQQ